MSAVDVALGPIREDEQRSGPAIYHARGGLDLSTNESIVIYITVGESSIPIRVMSSDPIASVKLRIQKCNKGFVVKRQKLVFGGRELYRAESLVQDYGIASGNVLHMALRISDILLINVRTTCGKEFELQVDRHRNIGYLKRRIARKGQKGHFIDLGNPDVFCHGEKLDDDHRLIHDISNDNVADNAVIHLVVHKSAKVRSKSVDRDVEISIDASEPAHGEEGFCRQLSVKGFNYTLPPFLKEMIRRVSDGLAFGRQPVRSSEGTGGTYFMQDASGEKYVAIFKPIDEEPLAVNNPLGLPVSEDGVGLKRGTRVGEGALREVVAYLLDHPKSGPRARVGDVEMVGFAGVLPTIMVRCLHGGFNHPEGFECSEEHVKVGSLQMFVKNNGSCEDVGPKDFPVEEVHKIGVFDMRTANADRHAGNILMRRDGEKGSIVLIPIDHGYCLPENFEDCTFDWLYWPQARHPFSQETLDYIKSLDAEKDISILNFYGLDLSTECARTLRISTMLLKKGAERGLTPFAIGNIMCREKMNEKSIIEKIVDGAKDSLLPETSGSAFLQAVSEIMDTTLDKLIMK